MSTVVAATPARPRAGRLLRTLSDERLVARVRSGDEAAFEVVYDRYHRQLLSFCRHMLGSREEAEDALQHTCISAYQALRSDERPIQLKAWLFTIARNRCLTMLRARREHADVEDHQPAVEGLASEVQRRADLRELLADMHRLPEDQRAALVLSELGAHSHEEIAVILGVRKEKVKALVFQAREQLSGSRAAREVDCTEIREQLATLRGGALRRTQLRRHVDTCPGCAAFRAEVQRQRAAMAVMLPVVPGVALKGSVLGAVFGGGGAASGFGGGGALVAGGAAAGAVGTAGAGGGGLFAMIGAQGAAVKALAVLVVAGGAGGTGYVAVDELSAAPKPSVQSATPATPAVPATPGVAPATPAIPATPAAPALQRRAGTPAGLTDKDKSGSPAKRRGAKRSSAPQPLPAGARGTTAKRSSKAAQAERRSAASSKGAATGRPATTRATGKPQVLRSRPTRSRRTTTGRGPSVEESTRTGNRRTLESETAKGRTTPTE